MEYVNEIEKFWKHSYLVYLHEFDDEGICVNADNEQDALDYAVDYAEEMGWFGLFLNESEIEETHSDEITFAGNHCQALSTTNILIKKID